MGSRVVPLLLLTCLGWACAPSSSKSAKSALAAANPRLVAQASLLPPELPAVMGIDVEALRLTEPWTQGLGMLETWPPLGIEQLSECGLGPASWRGVLVGLEPMGGPTVKVVMAEGIGRKSTLDCMELGPYPEVPDWYEPAYGHLLQSSDGNVLLVIDDDTVVSASPEIAHTVAQRTRHGGDSTLDPARQPALARADLSRHLWMVGRWTPPYGSESQWNDHVRDYAISIDLSEGLHVQATLGITDPASAPSTQDGLRDQIALFRSLLEMLHQPTALLDRVEVTAAGSLVTATLNVPKAELLPLQTQMIERVISPEPSPSRPANPGALRHEPGDDPWPL